MEPDAGTEAWTPPSGRRTLVAAVATTAVGAMPVWLIAALAVQMRAELGLSEAGLGLAVAVCFGTSALFSVPAGHLVERIGWRRGMILTAFLSTSSLLGLGALADSFRAVLFWIAVGGLGNSVGQPAANMGLSHVVATARQGLAFGIKQSAVPLATLVAGLAVPLFALTIGWRWAFLAALVGSAFLVFGVPRGRGENIRTAALPRTGDVAVPALVVLAIAGGLGAGAANSFGAFLVDAAVSFGVAPVAAGLALALGGIAGVVARISWGWSADRRAGGHFVVVAALMAVGSTGLVSLAYVDGSAQLVLVVLLVNCTGWGWPGLFAFAVIRHNPRAPAAASGIVLSGIYTGGVLGPLSFGMTADRLTYAVAWHGAGIAMLSGAALVLLGRQMLRRQLRLASGHAEPRLEGQHA